MTLQEYCGLMQSVSEFAGQIGLTTDGLYRPEYTPSDNEDSWVISVSQKGSLSQGEVLYRYMDQFKPDFDTRLTLPIIVGTEEQVRQHAETAKQKDADYFLKQTIAGEGFVQPSPEFLRLTQAEQVEYTLHEAFHRTPKKFYDNVVPHLNSPREEEASAMLVGHLGAVHYFKEHGLGDETFQNWSNHLSLVRKVKSFWSELEETYAFRLDATGNSVSLKQKIIDREEVFSRASQTFGDELGGPINNAFFIYWHYFYGAVPRILEKIEGLEDIKRDSKKVEEFRVRFS